MTQVRAAPLYANPFIPGPMHSTGSTVGDHPTSAVVIACNAWHSVHGSEYDSPKYLTSHHSTGSTVGGFPTLAVVIKDAIIAK